MVFEIQNYKFNPTRETFEEIIIGRTESQESFLTQNKKNNKGETQMETNNTTQQNNKTDWLTTEEQTLKTPGQYEKLPALKLETGKITSFEISFDKPFETWNTETNGKKVVKAIIPVKQDGVAKNFWCNKKNPLYSEIIRAGKNGQTKFKVFTTGSQAETKYALVKD